MKALYDLVPTDFDFSIVSLIILFFTNTGVNCHRYSINSPRKEYTLIFHFF